MLKNASTSSAVSVCSKKWLGKQMLLQNFLEICITDILWNTCEQQLLVIKRKLYRHIFQSCFKSREYKEWLKSDFKIKFQFKNVSLLEKASQEIFSAEAAMWIFSQISLKKTLKGVHFIVQFCWLINIRST